MVSHRARVKAQGTDAKDGGTVTASFRLVPADGGSKVLVHTDLVLSGAVAHRGGLGPPASAARFSEMKVF